jgi:hypothetical protein
LYPKCQSALEGATALFLTATKHPDAGTISGAPQPKETEKHTQTYHYVRFTDQKAFRILEGSVTASVGWYMEHNVYLLKG